MTESVTVNVEVTENPFGVKGDITVDDSAFSGDRTTFSANAGAEISKLGMQLHNLAMSEYDRRNARPE